MDKSTKGWVATVLLLLAAALFFVAAIQVEPADFENTEFDQFVALTLGFLGLAIWAAPGSA